MRGRKRCVHSTLLLHEACGKLQLQAEQSPQETAAPGQFSAFLVSIEPKIASDLLSFRLFMDSSKDNPDTVG
jgi:hypothetical protein